MEKNIDLFLKQDHEEHLERSLEAVKKHADLSNELTEAERKEYFEGLMGMFPMMMLGHYYGWLIGEEPKDYFDIFVPRFEEEAMPYIKQIINELFNEESGNLQKAAILAIYMQTYSYDLLQAFAKWADPEIGEKAAMFLATERTQQTMQLTKFITQKTEADQLVELASYLAGDFPFELLERFHKTVME